MELTTDIRATIEGAAAYALATTGPHGVNVVPVSVVHLADTDDIYLYDFFMGKTVANLQAEPDVAFTAWSGLAGVQIKATAVYETTGERFTTAVNEMQVQFPERTLRGLIILTPTTAYDVSAGANAGIELSA